MYMYPQLLLSKKDKELIEQSMKFTDGSDWNQIDKLIDLAESNEAKKILTRRMKTLYHLEEHFSGNL